MRAYYRFLVGFTVLLSIATSSCRRPTADETPTTRLTRKWLLIKSATDDNGNNAIDGSEYHPTQEGFLDYYTFASDNSGVETVTTPSGITTNYPFNWTLGADSLSITKAGGNLNRYKINDLSNANMELYLYTKIGLVAYYFQSR